MENNVVVTARTVTFTVTSVCFQNPLLRLHQPLVTAMLALKLLNAKLPVASATSVHSQALVDKCIFACPVLIELRP